MKVRLAFAVMAVAAVAGFHDVFARASSNITLTVTPTTPVFDANNVVGVSEDAAPGFQHGSFRSNGVAKTDMYFPPDVLFPSRETPVTIGDVVSISYWTKKDTPHNVNIVDWAFILYVKPYAGQLGTNFYGARFGSEPYFAVDPSDPGATWNQWTTADDEPNRMRFYESTSGVTGANFGTYNDPEFAAFRTGNTLSGHPVATREVMFFSIQTGSATAGGFLGQVDGLRIQLADGSIGRVNFEPFVVASDKDGCKKNGWMTLFRPNGGSFANQGDCVSFVTTGK
jgi:hypothetical protein